MANASDTLELVEALVDDEDDESSLDDDDFSYLDESSLDDDDISYLEGSSLDDEDDENSLDEDGAKFPINEGPPEGAARVDFCCGRGPVVGEAHTIPRVFFNRASYWSGPRAAVFQAFLFAAGLRRPLRPAALAFYQDAFFSFEEVEVEKNK